MAAYLPFSSCVGGGPTLGPRIFFKQILIVTFFLVFVALIPLRASFRFPNVAGLKPIVGWVRSVFEATSGFDSWIGAISFGPVGFGERLGPCLGDLRGGA